MANVIKDNLQNTYRDNNDTVDCTQRLNMGNFDLYSLKVTVPLLFIQIPVISRLLRNMGDTHTIPQ